MFYVVVVFMFLFVYILYKMLCTLMSIVNCNKLIIAPHIFSDNNITMSEKTHQAKPMHQIEHIWQKICRKFLKITPGKIMGYDQETSA